MACELCNDQGWIVTGQSYSSPHGEQEQCPLCVCRAEIERIRQAALKEQASAAKFAGMAQDFELALTDILVTCVEGVEFMSGQEIVESVKKTASGALNAKES